MTGRRVEERTPNTRDCPDTNHAHEWIKRPPELTPGTKLGISYEAGSDGTVVITEEALTQLLRMAGFIPRPDPDASRQPVHHGFLVSTPREMPRGVLHTRLPEDHPLRPEEGHR